MIFFLATFNAFTNFFSFVLFLLFFLPVCASFITSIFGGGALRQNKIACLTRIICLPKIIYGTHKSLLMRPSGQAPRSHDVWKPENFPSPASGRRLTQRPQNTQATIRDSYGNSLYHFCHGSEKTLIRNFLGEIAPRVRIAVMSINSGQLSRPAGFIESWTGHYRLQQQEINPRFLATTLSVYPSAGL